MTSTDDITYWRLRWVRTALQEDHDQYLRDFEEFKASGIDPMDLVASMAMALRPEVHRHPDGVALLDSLIEQFDTLRHLDVSPRIERQADE